jgi:hypothetical protein
MRVARFPSYARYLNLSMHLHDARLGGATVNSRGPSLKSLFWWQPAADSGQYVVASARVLLSTELQVTCFHELHRAVVSFTTKTNKRNRESSRWVAARAGENQGDGQQTDSTLLLTKTQNNLSTWLHTYILSR